MYVISPPVFAGNDTETDTDTDTDTGTQTDTQTQTKTHTDTVKDTAHLDRNGKVCGDAKDKERGPLQLVKGSIALPRCLVFRG
jgi:hypothetical protein